MNENREPSSLVRRSGCTAVLCLNQFCAVFVFMKEHIDVDLQTEEAMLDVQSTIILIKYLQKKAPSEESAPFIIHFLARAVMV